MCLCQLSFTICLFPDPIKSLRTSLPGKLRLAPRAHACSPGWHGFQLLLLLYCVNRQVAPLRVRPADVADLQKLFARGIAKSRGQGPLELTKEAVLQLESYTFPGNIKASIAAAQT